MSKQRRTFSAEDRYSIVQESLRDGHADISRKYNLSPSLLRKWRQKYLDSGKDGLRNSYVRVDPQVRALEEENERLKRIVAKQALELEPGGRCRKKRAAKKNSYRTQEKIAIMARYQRNATRKELCRWLEVPRSVTYYKPRQGTPGVKPSCETMTVDGVSVSNEDVIARIRQLIDTKFNAFGYEYITHELKKEYIINKKKVYRLMLANDLLLGKMIRPAGKRDFVQFRRIEATKPLEYLCWDIKYIWINGERRNYYLLCILDVFTRKIVDWIFQIGPPKRQHSTTGFNKFIAPR